MKLLRLSLLCLATFLALNQPVVAADAPAKFKVSEFNFSRPTSWEWVESTSSMRAAQLKVTKEKDVAEVVFYYFGAGSGGGTQANVDRWFSQFKEPRAEIKAKTEEVTVGKTKVTYVQAEGTYQSGMPGGAKTSLTDHALIGAIVEGGEGSVFIRMTGPKSLAKASLDDFKKMVESALK